MSKFFSGVLTAALLALGALPVIALSTAHAASLF